MSDTEGTPVVGFTIKPESLPLPDFARMRRVLQEVSHERDVQHARWGEQNHPDGTGPRVPVVHYVEAANAAWLANARTNHAAEKGTLTYLLILLEEVFEAAECEPGSVQLRSELVQVAAVATAWVEKIDRDNRAWIAARSGS